MNQDPFGVPHKHRRHFGVMVNMPDCCASDLGSIPGQVCQFLKIFFIRFIKFDEKYGKTRLCWQMTSIEAIFFRTTEKVRGIFWGGSTTSGYSKIGLMKLNPEISQIRFCLLNKEECLMYLKEQKVSNV